jgi:predicted aspartyl protease
MSQPLVCSHFPYLPVHFEARQRVDDVEALLDTGFDGALALPTDLVSNGQPPTGYSRWTLADGSTVSAPVYRGTVRVGPFGPFRGLITAIGDEPIVGRDITDRLRITLDHGQQLIVEP